MGILVFFLIFKEKAFSFSPVSVILPVGLSYMAFIMLYIPSVHTLKVFFFIINGGWIYQRLFSASIEMIIQFLSFFKNVVYHIDFWVFNHPCIPGINPTWSWHMLLLMYCWIWFANILLRIFASMFIKDISL